MLTPRHEPLRESTRSVGRWLVTTVLAGSLAASGCTGSDGGVSPPSSTPGTATMNALIIGTLSHDPKTGCVWLLPEQDPDAPVVVRWPADIQVRTDPVRLVDKNNTVIADEGDRLELGGGAGAGDEPRDPGCPDGPIVIVHEIIKVIPKTAQPSPAG